MRGDEATRCWVSVPLMRRFNLKYAITPVQDHSTEGHLKASPHPSFVGNSRSNDCPLPLTGEGEGERGLFRGCVFEPVQNKGLTARDP